MSKLRPDQIPLDPTTLEVASGNLKQVAGTDGSGTPPATDVSTTGLTGSLSGITNVQDALSILGASSFMLNPTTKKIPGTSNIITSASDPKDFTIVSESQISSQTNPILAVNLFSFLFRTQSNINNSQISFFSRLPYFIKNHLSFNNETFQVSALSQQTKTNLSVSTTTHRFQLGFPSYVYKGANSQTLTLAGLTAVNDSFRFEGGTLNTLCSIPGYSYATSDLISSYTSPGSGSPHTITGSSQSITVSANSRVLAIYGSNGGTTNNAYITLRDASNVAVAGGTGSFQVSDSPTGWGMYLSGQLSAGSHTYSLSVDNSVNVDGVFLSLIEIPSTAYAAKYADFTGTFNAPFNTFSEIVIATLTGITISEASRLAIYLRGSAGTSMGSGVAGLRYRLKKSITPGDIYYMSPLTATRNYNALTSTPITLLDVTPPLEDISPAETYTLEVLAYYTDTNPVSNAFSLDNSLFVVELPY